METIDLAKISQTVYASLAHNWHDDVLTELEKDAILTASSDGYSFPSNLDTDPPIDDLAPQTMKQLLRQALDQRWEKADYQAALLAQIERRKSKSISERFNHIRCFRDFNCGNFISTDFLF